jgi:methyltransferase FkbM-like protein
MRLLDYQKNIYSQSGEDGILAKILETLPNCDKWCVEFGAWDGQLFSNACHLIDDAGYSAVMIECDTARFKDLLKRHGKNPRVIGLNALVGFTEADSLDHLLAKTPIPKDFDLLSIDIDGNDYHVWNSTVLYKPKVVVIEFNPTIPTEFEYVQEADPGSNQGSSVLSLTRLGKTKGYELVSVTTLNAILVRSEYFPLFGIINNDARTLREDTSHLTYLVSTYDGKIIVMGHDHMTWHGIKYDWIIRQLPKMFQMYPSNFNPMRAILFKCYKGLFKLLYRVRNRVGKK